MITDKLRPHHLERKALLYVRQSSAHQVLHNRESSALQYAMRDRLIALGWSEIEVIDDDLGRSAAGAVQRAGFERMVAEVCLGKVGAVAAREVSRFARNSRDWQQLIEMCRVVDTVLVDQRRSTRRVTATIGFCSVSRAASTSTSLNGRLRLLSVIVRDESHFILANEGLARLIDRPGAEISAGRAPRRSKFLCRAPHTKIFGVFEIGAVKAHGYEAYRPLASSMRVPFGRASRPREGGFRFWTTRASRPVRSARNPRD